MAKLTKAERGVWKGPDPVKHDGRICFGIDFFTDEAVADAYGKFVQERGDTYNGGFYHGMACGRDTTFDYVDQKLGKLFAVTVR